MICTICNKSIGIAYMCEKDQEDLFYCPVCFETHPCELNHSEGCATLIMESTEL